MSAKQIYLNAKDKQDSYITNKEGFTHFYNKYQTHTNFAKDIIIIEADKKTNNDTKFVFGEIIRFDIDKSSDLLLNIKTQFKISGKHWEDPNKIVPETVHSLIDYIELVCDDKIIQRLTGDWLYVLYEGMGKNKKKNVVNTAFASRGNKTNMEGGLGDNDYILYLDIPFWFANNPRLSLPVWALQHENIHINLKLRNFSQITREDQIENEYVLSDINLISEYIELDNREKSKFINTPLEYIIEQVELSGIHVINGNKSISHDSHSPDNNKIIRKLVNIQKFNLVNEIVFFIRQEQKMINSSTTPSKKPFTFFNFWKYADGLNKQDHIKDCSITLNGKSIHGKLPGTFFRKIQKFQLKDSDYGYLPSLNTDTVCIESTFNNCIYQYAFGLNTYNVMPSGFLSMDKFNNINLDVHLRDHFYSRQLNIYVKHFNIIRIENGQLSILNN